jgi:hypothetical protein
MPSPTAQATRPRTNPQPIDLRAASAELDAALHELIAIYERLLDLTNRRREAINNAQPRKLAAYIAEENDLVQQIAQIEKRRMLAASRLADALGLPDKSQTTVRAIAAKLTGEPAERLTRSAATLRAIAERVQRANEIVKNAAETLAAHVEGLMRTVQCQLTRATTYEARGRMAMKPTAPAALDLRH